LVGTLLSSMSSAVATVCGVTLWFIRSLRKARKPSSTCSFTVNVLQSNAVLRQETLRGLRVAEDGREWLMQLMRQRARQFAERRTSGTMRYLFSLLFNFELDLFRRRDILRNTANEDGVAGGVEFDVRRIRLSRQFRGAMRNTVS
jgi:hypothetical protein